MIEQKRKLGVFSGGRQESLILKHLLESFFIEVFEDASLMAVFNPWGVLIGDNNSVKLRVNDKDFEKAKVIIENYNNGIYQL